MMGKAFEGLLGAMMWLQQINRVEIINPQTEEIL